MEEKILFEIELDADAAQRRSQDLAESIERDRQAVRDLNKEYKAGNITQREFTTEKNRLTNQVKVNTKELRLNNNIINSQENSLGRLRQQQKLLVAELDKLDISTEAGVAAQKELSAQILDLTNIINEADEATGNFRGNVGNYANDIREAIPFTGEFADTIDNLSGSARLAATGFSLINKSVNDTNKAFRVFKIVLASTGLGAILLLLSSLVTFLTSTQRGLAAVRKVTTPLVVLFQSLIGVLQNLGGEVFDRLVQAVENPKQALQDLGNFIRDQILVRFRAFGQAAIGISEILSGNVTTGFERLKQSGLDALTGIEDSANALNSALQSTRDLINQSIDAGARINALNSSINRGEIDLIKRRSELLRIAKEQNDVAEDTRATFEERANAARTAIAAEDELRELELAQIDRRIALLKLQQSFNDSSIEDEKELAQLQADRNDVQTSIQEARTTLRNKLNIIEQQQEAALQKQRIDNINSQIANLERLRLATRSFDNERLEIDRQINEQRTNLALENQALTEEQRLLIVAESLQREQDLETEFLERVANDRRQGIQDRIDEGADFFEKAQLERELEFIEESRKLTEDDRIKRLQIERDFVNEQQSIRIEQLQFEIGQLDEENNARLEKEAELASLRLEQQQEFSERSKEIESDRIGAERALQNARVAFFQDATNALVDNLDRQTVAGKAAVALQKAAAGAELAINFQRELSAINAANSIFPEPIGSIIKTTQRILAGVRLAKGIADLASIQFNDGGNIAFEGGNIPSNGGMIKGRSHNRGGVKFRMGNKVGEADGAKGEAFIVNTRNDSRLKGLASAVNVMGGGKPFAPALTNTFQDGGIINDLSSSTFAREESRQSLVDALAELPPPVVDLQEFSERNNEIAFVESKALIE